MLLAMELCLASMDEDWSLLLADAMFLKDLANWAPRLDTGISSIFLMPNVVIGFQVLTGSNGYRTNAERHLRA